MNVYFMRHGETDWNTIKRLQGTTDIPLNANGIALAERVSRAVHEAGIHFDRIYTSPLSRAVKTAELMNAYSACPLTRDERITEFCFGQAEGVTLSEIKTNPRYSWLASWFFQPEAYLAKLGAESYEHFFTRLESFLDMLRKEDAAHTGGTEENVLIVCHGGVVRGLMHCMTRETIANFATVKIPNCGLNLATLHDGAFSISYTAKVFAE